MKRGSSIESFLRPLQQAEIQAYLTNELQLADILEWILEQFGESKVWQTSFSISEEFLRRLYFIQREGKVKEFNLVLDHKATNKTVLLWAFIRQVVNRTYMADNHSKILLVESEKGEVVTVVTSQNLTRGNRAESAIVTTDLNVFRSLKGNILDIIKNKSIPFNEFFGQRTGEY